MKKVWKIWQEAVTRQTRVKTKEIEKRNWNFVLVSTWHAVFSTAWHILIAAVVPVNAVPYCNEGCLVEKRRCVGTKKEPTCSICHSRKHYGSTCPQLAQKLLRAVCQKTGVKNLLKAVSERKVLTVLEAKKKPLRTLKRRSRGNAAAGKKARQGRQSGAKGRKRNTASETMP